MLWFNTVLVLIGTALLGASCGAVGVFSVLRRRALVGDTVAHAALPGLGLAFLFFGRNLPALLLGAWITGMIGMAAVVALTEWTRLRQDAILGVVLSTFFGAGLAIDSAIQATKKPGQAGLESFLTGKTAGVLSMDVALLGVGALLALILVILLYKEWKVLAFDAGFARVQGWPIGALDYLLQALVAAMVVIGLPVVGVVLIAALLILPGSIARLWTERLHILLLMSAGIGIFVAVTGALLSATFDKLPAGPTIVLLGAALFLISFFFSPRHGILAKWLDRKWQQQQIEEQHFLLALLDQVKVGDCTIAAVASAAGWSTSKLRQVAKIEQRRGLLASVDPTIILSEKGETSAQEVAAAHAKWSEYQNAFPERAHAVADLNLIRAAQSLPADLPYDTVPAEDFGEEFPE